jgi:hypothetical protein
MLELMAEARARAIWDAALARTPRLVLADRPSPGVAAGPPVVVFTFCLRVDHPAHTAFADTEPVRRISLVLSLCLGALVFPLVAVGAVGAIGDGTLEVDNGSGAVTVQATGTVLAVADGTVRIRDTNAKDAVKPRLVGCDGPISNVSDDTLDPNDRILTCSGANVRVSMIGGTFRMRISGTEIYMSVVGQGKVVLDGQDWLDPGTYSLNGSAPAPLPSPAATFTLKDVASASAPPRLAS